MLETSTRCTKPEHTSLLIPWPPFICHSICTCLTQSLQHLTPSYENESPKRRPNACFQPMAWTDYASFSLLPTPSQSSPSFFNSAPFLSSPPLRRHYIILLFFSLLFFVFYCMFSSFLSLTLPHLCYILSFASTHMATFLQMLTHSFTSNSSFQVC